MVVLPGSPHALSLRILTRLAKSYLLVLSHADDSLRPPHLGSRAENLETGSFRLLDATGQRSEIYFHLHSAAG